MSTAYFIKQSVNTWQRNYWFKFAFSPLQHISFLLEMLVTVLGPLFQTKEFELSSYWIPKTVVNSSLIIVLCLFPGDSTRAFRLCVGWWESWPGHCHPQQPRLSRLPSPNRWGHKEVSEWLGQICSGHPADASENHLQEAQNPWRLRQEEAEISKVFLYILIYWFW